MVYFALLVCCSLGWVLKGRVCAVSAQMEYLWKSAAVVSGGGQGGIGEHRIIVFSSQDITTSAQIFFLSPTILIIH